MRLSCVSPRPWRGGGPGRPEPPLWGGGRPRGQGAGRGFNVGQVFCWARGALAVPGDVGKTKILAATRVSPPPFYRGLRVKTGPAGASQVLRLSALPWAQPTLTGDSKGPGWRFLYCGQKGQRTFPGFVRFKMCISQRCVCFSVI